MRSASSPLPSSASFIEAKRLISSMPRRLRMKQIVRTPRVTSSTSRSAASDTGDRRVSGPLLDHRRVPHRDLATGTRRPVVVEELEGQPGEPLGELARVGDRRRGQDEARLGTVDARNPAQPAAAHWRHASRRPRGRCGPRRQPPSRGWRGSPPNACDAAGPRRSACPGWSGPGWRGGESKADPPAACHRRRSPRAAREGAARRACEPGPARAPWSDRGRRPAGGAPARYPAIFSPRQTVCGRLIASIPCLNRLFLFRIRLYNLRVSTGLAVDLAVRPRKSATHSIPQ